MLSALPTELACPAASACPTVSVPPRELELLKVSEVPLDHIAELLSLLPVESADPVPEVIPWLDDSIIPLLSELVDEMPVVDDDESLPPTPAFTLAEATPGTPALTDAPAFQLSLWPEEAALLVPRLFELPEDTPLVFEIELPDEALSLCEALSVWPALPPLEELSL